MAVIDLRDGFDPVRELTVELIETVGRVDVDKHYGLYFVAADSEFSSLARFVERQVFFDRFGNDDDEMDREYGPYEPVSSFLLVIDHRHQEPVGVMRVMEVSATGPNLKTLDDVRNEPRWGKSVDDVVRTHGGLRGLEGFCDVGSIAVRRDTPGGEALLISGSLYYGLMLFTTALELEFIVAAIDEIVAGVIADAGIPLEPLCGLPAISYLGSEATRPYVIDVEESRRRARNGIAGVSLNPATYESTFSIPPVDLIDRGAHPTMLEPQLAGASRRSAATPSRPSADAR